MKACWPDADHSHQITFVDFETGDTNEMLMEKLDSPPMSNPFAAELITARRTTLLKMDVYVLEDQAAAIINEMLDNAQVHSWHQWHSAAQFANKIIKQHGLKL